MKPINFEKEQVELLEQLVINGVVNNKYEKIKKSILTKLKNAKKPPIKVSSRKAKGRELQYWVCKKIANIFNIEFNQQDDECLIHSREMGLNGKDVILRGYVAKDFPYDIECKCCEQLDIPNWIKQAKSNSKGNWLVVFKKKEIGEPVVLMGWDTFEKTYKGINK